MASTEVSESSAPLLKKQKTAMSKGDGGSLGSGGRGGRAGVYVILFLSVVVNVVFIVRESLPSAWPAAAVQDAERAALEQCSGHGDVFVDTLEVDEHGKPVCECHECFSGPDCSVATADCVANADVGDPLVLEEYWRANADLGTVVTPGWYRMGYFANDAQGNSFTDALLASIRELHALTGNAVTEGRYIVVGNGAMQLLSAVVHGLALQDVDEVSPVVATAPYYNLYPVQTNFLSSPHFEWAGEPVYASETRTQAGVPIQLIASPNNPTAEIQVVPDNFTGHVVYDHAYYWPHLTPITTAADSDIMIFTISKITGHAGSRMGWAILKDFDLYQKVSTHVFLSSGWVSRDAQLRATQILRSVTKSYAGGSSRQGIFHFGHEALASRWSRLQDIFGNSSRFSLQELKPEYCNFFGKVSSPSPAYAWIHCNSEADVDCNEVMKAAGIIGRPGINFGSSSRFVRLSLLKRQSSFDNLATHLANLVAQN